MSLFAPAPPKQKPPAIEEFSMPTCSEGIIMGDLLGTDKLSGNIFWYGKNRSEAIKEKQDTGAKGGDSSTKVTTGYKYYLSWAVGLCIGPVDELFTVWSGEDVLWEGSLTRPESGGYSTITLANMGTVYFYFGTSDQPRHPTMDAELGAGANSPSRHLCYAFFDDCLLGSSNRVPNIDFVVRKTPTVEWSPEERVGFYAYNPAHAIYYIIKEHTELPIELIDEDNFASEASVLSQEIRGVNVRLNKEQTAMAYIEEILTHIDATFFYADNSKFKLKLLRGDEDTGDLPVFGEVDYIDEPEINRRSYAESINEVKVKYLEITGVKCPPGIPLEWDSENSPETILQSDSVSVFVTGGQQPIRWTVEGTGYSIGTEFTTDNTNDVIASGSACGAAIITCRDACGVSITGSLRNTDSGQWVSKGAYCGAPGLKDPSWVKSGITYGSVWTFEGDATYGYQRQYQVVKTNWGCGWTSPYYGTEESCNQARYDNAGSFESECLDWTSPLWFGSTGCGGWYYYVGGRNYARLCTYSVGGWRYIAGPFYLNPITLNYYEWECP